MQASIHSSSIVMTAAAQNLLCLQLAGGLGVQFDDPFATWVSGACVPVLCGACTEAASSAAGLLLARATGVRAWLQP